MAGVVDPLAGFRDSINEGERSSLVWPDVGEGCPVEQGQVFELRSCHIEITRTQRHRHGRTWIWRAVFARYDKGAARPYVLARGAGDDGEGYVRTGSGGMPMGDLATLDPTDPSSAEEERADARNVPHPINGEPPEPEAIPPREVKNLPSTVAAQARFAEERRELTLARLRRSIVEEVKERLSGADEQTLERVREALREAA